MGVIVPTSWSVIGTVAMKAALAHYGQLIHLLASKDGTQQDFVTLH